MNRLFLWSLLCLGTLSIPSASFAQTGTIAGTIVDAENGETIIGANVLVAGTTFGAATDIDGNFSIPSLQPGTYTINATYIGYNPITIQNVDVVAGETTRLEFAMTSDAVAMEELVVEARALQNTEASLLRDRQKSAAVSDAISAEAISRSGAGDAAAAMTKVTGASVVGGKYVYIRGLGDRYATTTLNGSTLPSADPDRKAFQLDLFPSALLDNIVTLKTFTPDKPGDFSGGLVDVSTKTFPDAFTLQFSTSITYDELASGASNFLTYAGGNQDWLGFDDGTRALPDLLDGHDPTQQLPTQQDLRDVQRDVTNEDRASRAQTLNDFANAFNGVMTPTQDTAPVNYSFSGAIGGQSAFLGMPLGYTGSLSYGRSFSFYDDGVFSRWQLVGGSVDDVDDLTSEAYFGPNPDLDVISRADPLEQSQFSNARGTEETNWGASGTLALRPSPNNELSLTVLRTQSGISQAAQLSGFRDQNDAATFVTRALGYQERSLQTYQLGGEHYLNPITVEWKASYGRNTQEEPDLRYFSSTSNIQQTVAGLDTTYGLGGGNAPPPQRFFRDLEEDNIGLKLDVSVPFRQWNNLSAKLKVGGAFDDAGRIFRQRRFVYEEGRSVDFRDFEGDTDAYFSPDNFGVQDTLNVGDITAFDAGLYIIENSPPRANYDADRTVAAGYVMLELPVTSKLKLIGGARLETTQITNESFDDTLADSLRIGELDQTDLLPSLNAVYALNEQMNLRAAATRTLARPTFRELAPFQSFDFVGGDILEGNPLLDRTLITNLDLRWEWFIRPGELLAFSAFYKDFDQPIERVLRTVGEGRFVSFQNVDQARVYGVELEARKRLDAFTSNPVLSRISLGGNFSLVESVVDIPAEEMIIIRASDPDASDTRSLEGQSPYLLNLSADYQNVESGTSIGIFYNIFGDRLLAVTEGATPDVFEKARGDLDLTISQDLPANLRVKLTAKNLLGADMREIQTFKDVEYDFRAFSRARTISIGVTYAID
ncbi:MAG: TonB-dependent receptor [Bacteroidota bacterium]